MRETRIVAAPVEVRDVTDVTATISGYAALFDVPYEVWGFTESVAPTAFDKTLKERGGYDLAVVWSHDGDRVLGTEESETARFATDDRGLSYAADLDLLDPDGLGAFRKVKTRKVRQSSFSFETIRDEWEYPDDDDDSGKLPHRTLKEVRLWEASPVLWGANPETVVDVARAARSLAESRHVEVADATAALIAHDLSALTTPDTTSESREDATTETPADAPPEGAPVATSPPEPERKRPIYIPGL